MCGNLERGGLMGACLIHCHMFHRKLIIMVCMYSWILCVCFFVNHSRHCLWGKWFCYPTHGKSFLTTYTWFFSPLFVQGYNKDRWAGFDQSWQCSNFTDASRLNMSCMVSDGVFRNVELWVRYIILKIIQINIIQILNFHNRKYETKKEDTLQSNKSNNSN